MPIVSTQAVWACELSVMGPGVGPGSPGGRSCSMPARENLLKEACLEMPLLFVCFEQVIMCCAQEGTERMRKRGVSHNPKCFCPVWAKVLADGRPFCSQKESDSSNRDRDIRVNHSLSLTHSISKSTSRFIWSRCIPAPARPVGPGTPTDATDRESDFQHSPNIERSPCSNHREPVPWSARSACVSSSPDTVHQWANVSALVSAFTRWCRGPSCAPEMDIVNYSCPWDFSATSLDGHRILLMCWAGWETAVSRVNTLRSGL